jgi:hypothetical protein
MMLMAIDTAINSPLHSSTDAGFMHCTVSPGLMMVELMVHSVALQDMPC